MANGMSLNMFDPEAVVLLVLPALTARLVQEEVWSQTSWPMGEPRLWDHILAHAGTYRGGMLAEARRTLGVGRLAMEDA